MSKINLNNYEAFVLDHLEGRLSAEEIAELKAFLVLHPELQIDLDNNDLPYLENEVSAFSSKEELKKEANDEIIAYIENLLSKEQKQNFEKKIAADEEYKNLFHTYSKTKLVADPSVLFEGKDILMKSEEQWMNNDPAFNYIEGELSSAERIAFEKEILADAKLAHELLSYSRTKLKTDVSIIYPNKEELKKDAIVLPLFSTRTIISIAAAILLIVGLVVIFNVYNSDPEVKMEIAKKNDLVPVKKDDNVVKEENRVESPAINSEKKIEKTFASNNSYKKEVIVKDTAKLIQDPEVEHSSLQDKEKLIVKEEKNIPEEVKEVIDPKNILVDPRKNDSTALAKVIIEKKENTKEELKKIPMLAYEADDEAEPSDEPRKQGFFQRLAKAAGQVNKLGMTAVNGSENKGEGYLLSFNNLSIEKK